MEGFWVNVFIAVMLGASGFVVIWVARVTASGRMGRNGWAGIRTPSTMASDEAWLAAHRAGRRMTELAGWSLVAAGLASLFLAEGAEEAAAVPTLVGAAACGVFILIAARQGTRAAKQVTERQQHQPETP